MSSIQKKWHESLININDIDFKMISFDKIISYPPAGNDVFKFVYVEDGKTLNLL